MRKSLYYFNHKNLQYEKVKPTIKNFLIRGLSIVFFGLLFAGGVLFVAYSFFHSPKELMLQREIDQFKLQYEIINEKMERLEKVADNLQDRDDNIYRLIFEADPVPKEMRQGGMGGTDRYEKLKGFKNSDVFLNSVKRVDELSNRLYIQSKSYDEVFNMARNVDEMAKCIPAIQPIHKRYKNRITSYYGYRIHPIYKERIFHDGLDFSAPQGTDVYAAGDGVIEMASRSGYGYGNKIIINHGYGYQTVYAHLMSFKVSEGQHVKRGQLIGTVGSTGLSTSPHLHYEILRNNKKVNPIFYFFNDLNPQEYEEVLSTASKSTGVSSF